MSLTAQQCALAAQVIPVMLLALVVEQRAIGLRARGQRLILTAGMVSGFAGTLWAFNFSAEGATGLFAFLIWSGLIVPMGALAGALWATVWPARRPRTEGLAGE